MTNHSVLSFHLTQQSSNRKTGPIPVSTSCASTCPLSCKLREICYAKYGPLNLHWTLVSNGDRGVPFPEFLNQIRALPAGQLWRHNEAGDLPGQGDAINAGMLQALVDVNQGKRGFTYTHKPVVSHPENAEAIRQANRKGFTVNLSADSITEADELVALEIGPVAVVLPEHTRKAFKTPRGNFVIVCPNALNEKAKCKSCQLCQKVDRKPIIGFPVHGSGKKHFNA